MTSDALRKKLLKKRNQNNLDNDAKNEKKPPLPETKKTYLTVPSINDDYTSDGYSSNASLYSDITDSYPNSFYSESETEIQSTRSNSSSKIEEIIDTDNSNAKTQTASAKKFLSRRRSRKRHHSHGPKSIFAFRRVYFILGIFIGAFTIYFATKTMDEYKDMPSIFKNILNDIGMTEYFSTDFVANMAKIVGENFSEDDNFLPGRDLAKTYNLTTKYPIFIIPGITSCGLETWMDPNAESTKCSETYFRKRMWGTLNMPKAILLDRKCWLEHMMLDPTTGLDPPGYKLRASPGKYYI